MLPATPKLRRMITVNSGTDTWEKATIHSPPLRMVPAVSCSRPTAKPGLSTRFKIGRWKTSHRSRSRRSLSQPSAVRAPPEYYDDLKKRSQAELGDYLNSKYQPANTTLFIVGTIEAEEA